MSSGSRLGLVFTEVVRVRVKVGLGPVDDRVIVDFVTRLLRDLHGGGAWHTGHACSLRLDEHYFVQALL